MTEDFLALALNAERHSHAREDADYPQFHVAPPVGRLNDPNGLIKVDDTYHAFFQYTPEHPKKLVYWGHAMSKNLVNWEYLEPAILPDSHQDANGAYSGTAIATEEGVELWYTGNYKDPQTGEREATQCVVVTPDMKSYTKLVPPIIGHQPDGYTAHFRDPQVWADPEVPGSYRMLLGVQRENETGATLLYRSSDLRTWECEGEMTFPDANGAFDAFGYMWECPNLVRLSDEVTGEVRDVLIFCPQGIAPDVEGYENIFRCIYIVGKLVGTQFTECDGSFTELDRGFEFYAPQVYARTDTAWGAWSDEKPALLVGWAGNASEDDQPSIETGGWVHCLTSPRQLVLVDGVLVQRPYLPGLPLSFDSEVETLAGSRSWRFSADVEFNAPSASSSDEAASVTFAIGSTGAGVNVVLSPSSLTVDRSDSRYPNGDTRTVTLTEEESKHIEIIHDRSLTEIFLGDGRKAFTFRSFLNGEAAGLEARCESGSATLTNVCRARLD